MDLRDYDESFKNAATDDFVPEGLYQCRISEAILGTARTGTPLVKWTFTIMAGNQTKRKLYLNNAITEAAFRILKRNLLRVGWDDKIHKISEIERFLVSCVNKIVEVNHARGKGEDFQGRPQFNDYIKKEITTSEEMADFAPPPPIGEPPF